MLNQKVKARIWFLVTSLAILIIFFLIGTAVFKNGMLSVEDGILNVNPYRINPSITTTEIILSPMPDENVCYRAKPYNNLPEFNRVISIIIQRFEQNAVTYGVAKADPFIEALKSVNNCLDIRYADLTKENADGFFLFDPNSSVNDLKIIVDNSYINYDDLLTATLLIHELQHAEEFVNFKTTGFENTCVDKEINAFMREAILLGSFNLEEKKSISQRIANNPNANSAYRSLAYLTGDLSKNALKRCNINPYSSSLKDQEAVCYLREQQNLLREMITNNVFYQKQCATN